MIIPMIAYKTVLTMISTRRGTRLEYINVIDQKEKSIVAVKRAPKMAPVFNPSIIPLAFPRSRNKVRNNAASRFDIIIAHQIISPSGLFAHIFVLEEKKSISRIP
jgi:hypothetical protein